MGESSTNAPFDFPAFGEIQYAAYTLRFGFQCDSRKNAASGKPGLGGIGPPRRTRAVSQAGFPPKWRVLHPRPLCTNPPPGVAWACSPELEKRSQLFVPPDCAWLLSHPSKPVRLLAPFASEMASAALMANCLEDRPGVVLRGGMDPPRRRPPASLTFGCGLRPQDDPYVSAWQNLANLGAPGDPCRFESGNRIRRPVGRHGQ